ncbi:flagellar basal body-associated FliL family protein [Defluviimonas sp. WL0002]|uniref:Flagellar protein FliL n=1 Tax=Albidovulum marisflavi TaxID=2984159 RepID=A0ABT2Z7N4_9RHOB|nr:flagellar basal body-associated FliL family protein [Defluviimonas sp. WL0002]MCV2867092.1 flagellar basal body-associated FliL family protein [Defluviimonas sp. WL0002]
MADSQSENAAGKGGKTGRGLIFGLILALAGGGAAFYSVYSGLILGHHGPAEAETGAKPSQMPEVAFVPVERIVLPLGSGDTGRYLHFAAQIEVPLAHEQETLHFLPRVTDVLNTYLRAVEPEDLSEKTALIRLRAQMLRRVQVVLGEGRARDLLITEFVIN